MQRQFFGVVFMLWIGLTSICWAQSADEYFEQGLAFFKQQKLDRAIEAFENAVALDPTHIQAYLEMGFAYRLQDDFENARNAYIKALEIDQDNASAHLRLGEIYQLIGNQDAAEDEFAEYSRITSQQSQ
jgi:Tfp pilus assembly protein PilF